MFLHNDFCALHICSPPTVLPPLAGNPAAWLIRYIREKYSHFLRGDGIGAYSILYKQPDKRTTAKKLQSHGNLCVVPGICMDNLGKGWEGRIWA